MQMDCLKTCQTENFSTPGKIGQLESALVTKVKVIVRVRPFLPQEINSRDGKPISCVSVLNSESEPSEDVTVHLKDYETCRNECYKLDAFFGQEDNNISEIFGKEVNPLIPGLLHGRNVTVFAYGATGSGKTYTMQGTENLPGLMPLAMSSILSKSQGQSTIAISYYEIYMDRCYDLLELKEKEIFILDNKDGQIHLKGLAQVTISSMSEFQEAFSCVVQRRKVAHTGVNDVSSRSHAVLTIYVSTPCCDDTGNVVTGKLNLIDLAGNEDNRRTCNTGIRLQESAKINQSLFALSNVIYALNNNQPRIPYRESKLTRVLQDSLGGTSRALMIACLNPGEYQESLHTVSLAARSRHISNFCASAQKGVTPKVKVDMEAKLRAWLESKGKTKSAQRIGAFDSPFTIKTPNSICSTKKLSLFESSSKHKFISKQGASSIKKRDPDGACRNLFNNGHRSNVTAEAQELADCGNREEKKFEVFAESVAPESNTLVHDEKTNAEEKVRTVDCFSSSKACEVVTPRKVLSPINSNINNENIPAIGTPLDKFSTQSSNLKNSLVQEYIELLNTASKEQLMEIKGIGQKMAEYIIELRETSPMKSLDDLEKIGLSSKQVHNLFRWAARGVLG
ncbi:kinesin-like protein KIN-10B [Nicotiana tabacum]|uniref:Kinesin-like protein n=2 Tax=Nicotiana TaxID=4085 RepID=A0A1S4BMR9_TOBAC|nr:PREDICTED: kinesin-like protein KIF22 [Nicotiana sylvestris]XP_016490191.1 PREDICTED: kinesin-like protein KIF22 [Nicotiana tabacum]